MNNFLKLIRTGEAVASAFDEELHRYTSPSGRVLPSVSKIISPVTAVAYGGINKPILTIAAKFGTAVHKACELLDTEADELDDLEDLEPEWIPPIEAYLEWREKSGASISPDCVELRLACERYAGTLDRLAYIEGEPWVIDLKTTSTIHPHVGLQLAGYTALACLHRPELRGQPIRRGALQLTKAGQFKLVEFSDIRDFSTFSALLTLCEWGEENNYTWER